MRIPPDKHARRRSRDDSGQVAVEFALVLTVLCLILFGILRFGLLFYNYIDLTSATRVGARKASISRNDATAWAPVRKTVKDSTAVVNDDNPAITVSPSPPWASGTDVTVKVSY